MPISDHLSDRYDLPPVSPTKNQLESISHRKSSKDRFAKMDTIDGSSESPVFTDGTKENIKTHIKDKIAMQERTGSSTSKSHSGHSGSRPQPTRRTKTSRDQKAGMINLNQSNGGCYYEPKPFSPPTSVQEPYLQ